MKKTDDNPSSKTAPVVIVAAVIIIVAGLMAAKIILIPLMLAIFIGIISAQPVRWLTEHKTPHWAAVLIVLTGMFGTIFIVGGVVASSISNFSEKVPEYQENITEMTRKLLSGMESIGVDISSEQMASVIEPGRVFGYATEFLSEIGSILGNSFLILFIVLFMLFDINTFPTKMKAIEKLNGSSFNYLHEISVNIRNYLAIKSVISLLTGVLVTICLAIIGVDYPILWGMIAFMLNYIPSIGSFIAAVPAVLLALVQLGIPATIWTAAVYVGVNMLMGNILEPKVMGKGLGLSTLVVFISLIVWGFVFGPLGMFLSVPLTMSIKIMLEQHEDTRMFAVLLGSEKEAGELLA